MVPKQRGNAQVSDIIQLIEGIAPSFLAEDWDNCGLQVGSAKWTVEKIWVALDPLHDVVQSAASQNVDMIITHHPLIFNPLRTIDVETSVGKVIETLLDAKIALYSAHTNLDSAGQGVNEVLARKIGLRELMPMLPYADADDGDMFGMGRVGTLAKKTPLLKLAQHIKAALNVPCIKIVGDPEMEVHQVAVCSGSGSSLLDDFFRTGAQVYISGDLRYHDARRVEDESRALIDIGHFNSEILIVEPLVEQLKLAMQTGQYQVSIEPCKLEKDPFLVC